MWNASSAEVVLSLCRPGNLTEDVSYVVFVSVINPPVEQAAPNVFISAFSASKRQLMAWYPLAKPSKIATGGGGLASEGFADPMRVVHAGFTTANLAQSSALISHENTLTLTLVAGIAVSTASPLVSLIGVPLPEGGSLAFEMTGLHGATGELLLPLRAPAGLRGGLLKSLPLPSDVMQLIS